MIEENPKNAFCYSEVFHYEKIVLIVVTLCLLLVVLVGCDELTIESTELTLNRLNVVTESKITVQDYLQVSHTVIWDADLPEGFAGFSLALHEMYALAAWVNNDGFFIVPNNYGHWYMSIAQLTDYSSAEEWVYSMIERANIESQILAGVDANRTYSNFTFGSPCYG